jgi:hypothetical protein
MWSYIDRIQVLIPLTLSLKKEVVCSSEKIISLFQTTRYLISEDSNRLERIWQEAIVTWNRVWKFGWNQHRIGSILAMLLNLHWIIRVYGFVCILLLGKIKNLFFGKSRLVELSLKFFSISPMGSKWKYYKNLYIQFWLCAPIKQRTFLLTYLFIYQWLYSPFAGSWLLFSVS